MIHTGIPTRKRRAMWTEMGGFIRSYKIAAD